MKHKTLQFALDDAVERKSFKSVGSRFQARGAATEKALSPIFRPVLGTTKSQLLDERSDDRKGMLEAGVNRLAL